MILQLRGEKVLYTSYTPMKNVNLLVANLGEFREGIRLFPTPEAIAGSCLDFLRIPESRKQTLRNLSDHFINNNDAHDCENWISLKGIGPWTISYARMRGQSHPDIYLAGDLHVKKFTHVNLPDFEHEQIAPWRSYLTFQIWNKVDTSLT